MPLEGPVHTAGPGPVALIASVTVRPQPSAQTPAQILRDVHVVRSIYNFSEFAICPEAQPSPFNVFLTSSEGQNPKTKT